MRGGEGMTATKKHRIKCELLCWCSYACLVVAVYFARDIGWWVILAVQPGLFFLTRLAKIAKGALE